MFEKLIELPCQINIVTLLSGSLEKEADETLFLELVLRGYNLSKLRDEETTAEIMKIGSEREQFRFPFTISFTRFY